MKYFIFFILIFLGACKGDDKAATFSDPPYTLNSPSYFPSPKIPDDNPLTVNKVYLGRMLFYEKGISEDNKISCASCHIQKFAFGDSLPLSTKVNHGSTTRNTSVLFNLVYTNTFFWDGRTKTLELTCQDALLGEQNFNISYVKDRLMVRDDYKKYFKAAFNTTEPTNDMVVKALASFIRTMVSANSKYDKGRKEGDFSKYYNASEKLGFGLYGDLDGGDCFHCHGDAHGVPLFTDNLFNNNGLDTVTYPSEFIDKGLGKFTGNELENGKFKTPSLRNISFTAPYMHDGRFKTFDDVLEHYNTGVKISPTISGTMEKRSQGGIHLPPDKLANLKAFILTLNDYEFIKDTSFSNPFK